MDVRRRVPVAPRGHWSRCMSLPAGNSAILALRDEFLKTAALIEDELAAVIAEGRGHLAAPLLRRETFC